MPGAPNEDRDTPSAAIDLSKSTMEYAAIRFEIASEIAKTALKLSLSVSRIP